MKNNKTKPDKNERLSPKLDRNERLTLRILIVAISGAIIYLWTFSPYGSLGAADGQSYEVDRISLTIYIGLPLAAAVYWLSKCK